jgi:hypothetical protein
MQVVVLNFYIIVCYVIRTLIYITYSGVAGILQGYPPDQYEQMVDHSPFLTKPVQMNANGCFKLSLNGNKEICLIDIENVMSDVVYVDCM